jgi:hypothetical protein
MRKLTLIAALALLAVPSVAQASGSHAAARASAVRDCKALRTSLGVSTFRTTYRTFGGCVSRWTAEEVENTRNAAQTCRAEKADPNFAASHDGKTFAQFYGTNANGANAFGKCVSTLARAKSADDRADVVNAAKTCKAERADAGFATAHDGKSFADFYGTNANKSNAFGKCVSAHAAAADEDDAQAS